MMPVRNFLLKKAAGLSSPPVQERERDPRSTLVIVGTIRVGEERLPARISDLSREGFGARSVRALPIGSSILVSLPLIGEVRAQVRWALGDMFGARFLDPVDVGPLLRDLPARVQAGANSAISEA
jgi:hypothetical protein